MICGKDLDEVFAYQTLKVVVLKDRKLGLIALSLKLLIFCYIFLYTILYQGKHLSVADIDGVNRLSIRNPTEGMCDPFEVGCRANYSEYHDLPYCLQSPIEYLHGTGIKRTCQIWDSVEVTHDAESGVLLPTRIRRYDQVRACEPSPENNWSCHPSPYEYLAADGDRQKARGEATPLYDAFIADIERFTVLVDHNFRRYGGMMEDDIDMNGHYYECPNHQSRVWDCELRQVPCAHRDCPDGSVNLKDERSHEETLLTLRGRRKGRVASNWEASGPEEDYAHLASQILSHPRGRAVAMPKGDVFTVGSLLKLANMEIDTKGKFSTTHRARGLVLVIHIQYDNRAPGTWLGFSVTPWRTPKPFYTYRVTFRDAADYRQTKTFNDPADAKRTIRIYNGIRLVMEQGGAIAVWDTAFFLITMTTALGLMAVANTLTDLLLCNFLPQSEEYSKRKFHHSKDFNPEDDAEPEAATAKPTTRKEAGSRFLDALESQDAEAIADTLPTLMEFVGKKDS